MQAFFKLFRRSKRVWPDEIGNDIAFPADREEAFTHLYKELFGMSTKDITHIVLDNWTDKQILDYLKRKS